jgi:cyclohexa-1,5-dienecarbonyl-CoA hydratase
MTEPARPMTSGDTVRLDVREHAAWITLDRPPLNVLDIATNRALAACVRSLALRPDVRVVALCGAGERAFSAGVAIEDHVPARVGEMLEAFHGVFRALIELGRPTIALVRGAALGGGCELVAFADAALAAESATFGLPEISLGCLPPVAALVLPAVVGAKAAVEMALSGDTINAARACAIGLVNRVVPDESFDEEARAFVARFARHSGSSLALAHEAFAPALRGGRDRGAFLAELARVEALYLERLMATHDAAEGIAAWREKRAPVWRDE